MIKSFFDKLGIEYLANASLNNYNTYKIVVKILAFKPLLPHSNCTIKVTGWINNYYCVFMCISPCSGYIISFSKGKWKNNNNKT